MKMSVVTNAFNQAPFLRDAVESVLAQDGAELEYFVVDPGSTDGTADVLAALTREYPGRFTVIAEPDKGAADGLNKAFARATGDWFHYLNADDYMLPGAYAAASAAIAAHPDAGAITAAGYVVDAAGRSLAQFHARRHTAIRAVRGRAPAFQQSTFYRAAPFRGIGGFNEGNHTSWDGEILLDLMLAGYDVATVPGMWSAFRVHGASITGSGRLTSQFRVDEARNFARVIGRERSAGDPLRETAIRLFDLISEPQRSVPALLDRLIKRRMGKPILPARPR